MKQGTVSVLFGCHSPMHSVIVLVAWRKWHNRWPSWWQIVCIFLHDIGHWGVDYLDNYEAKRHHHILGARAAYCLFGRKGYKLIARHNSYGKQHRSLMFHPDKYSWVIAPLWWMTTNTWFERKLVRPGHTGIDSARMFKKAMTANMEDDFAEQGHEIYLNQWQAGNHLQ